jgi:hypothetical protein
LIVYLPRRLAPRVVSTPARHVDVLPTILDALSLPVPEGLPGRSLLPDATGTPAPAGTPTYFEALSGRLNRGWAPLHGVIREGVKYVDLPSPSCTTCERPARGPEPRRGGAEPCRAAAGAPDAVPRRRRRRGRQSRRMPRRGERLRSLGYLASGAGSGAALRRFGEDDDPKRLIGLDARLQEVVGLSIAGDLPAALARGRELVRLRPE